MVKSDILGQARKEKRTLLTEIESKELLKEAGIPVVEAKLARTKTEAMNIALTTGDGGWATIGELWLWVGGGGPIVERTLEKYGFNKKKE